MLRIKALPSINLLAPVVNTRIKWVSYHYWCCRSFLRPFANAEASEVVEGTGFVYSFKYAYK
jgi:hypothetical protein